MKPSARGPDNAWKCQQCLLAGTKLWRLVSTVPKQRRERLISLLSERPWATRQAGARGMLGDFQARRKTTLAALKQADALIAPTAYARRILEAGGAPHGSIAVMPCGGSWDWTKDLYQTESSQLRIGFLGNVIPTKGVHLLIVAYQSLRAAGLPMQLQIWGDVSLAPEYYRTLRENAPSEVVWGGHYDRNDLARILSGLDVVVVPSIWHETQGIVIQEAFAAGLPAIVSADTSLTESVLPGESGLWFEQGSSEDLARQIRRLLDEPDLLDHLRAGIPVVRNIEEDVTYLRRIYARLAHPL